MDVVTTVPCGLLPHGYGVSRHHMDREAGECAWDRVLTYNAARQPVTQCNGVRIASTKQTALLPWDNTFA